MKAENIKKLADALDKLGYEIRKIEPELSKQPSYLNSETSNIVITVSELTSHQ